MVIVLAFRCRISVTRGLPFVRRFAGMAGPVPGVSAPSFGIDCFGRLASDVEVRERQTGGTGAAATVCRLPR